MGLRLGRTTFIILTDLRVEVTTCHSGLQGKHHILAEHRSKGKV